MTNLLPPHSDRGDERAHLTVDDCAAAEIGLQERDNQITQLASRLSECEGERDWQAQLAASWRLDAERAEGEVERLRIAMEEAQRCLTLIGHVPRSENTWADRCEAASRVLVAALQNTAQSRASNQSAQEQE